MEIGDIHFVKSSPSVEACPKPDVPEYAFAGRSNVGKSSLINMLAGRRGLAKISAKPGKTRLINHFRVDNCWYLADLPGYGFARVPKTDRNKWRSLITGYLAGRINLACLFVLIDARLEPQASDLEFIDRIGHAGLPFVIVFTKADKLSHDALQTNMAGFGKAMLSTWEELPRTFVTSSVKGTGRKELLDFIAGVNGQWKERGTP